MADPIFQPKLFDTLGAAMAYAEARVQREIWTAVVTLLDDGKFCVQHSGIHNRPRGLRIATVHINLRTTGNPAGIERTRVEYHV